MMTTSYVEAVKLAVYFQTLLEERKGPDLPIPAYRYVDNWQHFMPQNALDRAFCG
jgi:hypothetical protein